MSDEVKPTLEQGRTLLTREQVRAAIHFARPPRPPRANSLWHNPATLAAHGDDFRALLVDYPDDTVNVSMWIDYWQAPEDGPTYRFAFGDKVKPDEIPHFAYPVIDDWSELDQFLGEFPMAERPDATDSTIW